MNTSRKPLIVIFGAGNIGRSFIAPVFTRGGYEAVFADVSTPVLGALKERNHYTLVEKSDDGEVQHEVTPVRGVDARDFKAVKTELDRADLCVTCVGAGALPSVLKTIAEAAVSRAQTLDIILAENLKGAGDLAREAFQAAGIKEEEYRRRLGVIETSIGKMVPIMPVEVAETDPLLSWAESFNTLIVDADGFTGPIPKIKDLSAVSPIAPWVARKLYIHNFGHAAVAYFAYATKPETRFIWEALEIPEVARACAEAMRISGKALCREYPDIFSEKDITTHIEDLLQRFRNRALGDTIYRVGRDLARKLHRRDRVVGALALAEKHGLETEALLEVFRAALSFHAPGPSGKPDRKDLEVLEAAGKPSGFLQDIVCISSDEEPAMAAALRNLLEERAGKERATSV